MPLRSLFPVIVTPTLEAARDFYVEHFGFEVVFEADWYVQLHAARAGGAPPLELALMLPDLNSQPEPLRAAFGGDGMILTIEVDHVDEMYAKLKGHGALGQIIVDLKDEPWGQRHFLMRDPAGILLDVVQLIPPSPEYAAAYSSK